MRLGKALCFLVLFFFSGLAYAREIWVNGQGYGIIEIFRATSLEKNGNETRVSNPFAGKIVSLKFIPGYSWRHNQKLLKVFWPLIQVESRGSFTETGSLFYSIDGEILISDDKSPFGNIEFKWYRHAPSIKYLPATLQVAEEIVKTFRLQTEHHRLVCLEMTGTLVFQGTSERNEIQDDGLVENISQAKYGFVFIPESARILGFVDGASGEITPIN